MDYYTTFSYVRANSLFTSFVACVADAKRDGEGKGQGEGEKGKYGGKGQGPPIFPFTFQLLLRKLFFLFLFFFLAKGRATGNIIIKWIRPLK